MSKRELQAALAERDWWNEIGALWDTTVSGWTGCYNASFDNGITVGDRRVAQSLYKYAQIIKEQ